MNTLDQFEAGSYVRELSTQRRGKVIDIEPPFIVVQWFGVYGYKGNIDRVLPKEVNYIRPLRRIRASYEDDYI